MKASKFKKWPPYIKNLNVKPNMRTCHHSNKLIGWGWYLLCTSTPTSLHLCVSVSRLSSLSSLRSRLLLLSLMPRTHRLHQSVGSIRKSRSLHNERCSPPSYCGSPSVFQVKHALALSITCLELSACTRNAGISAIVSAIGNILGNSYSNCSL